MKHKVNPLRHQVIFSTTDKLNIEVETTDLLIRTIQETDKDAIYDLTKDPEVMAKFAAGNTWKQEDVQRRMAIWRNRWEKNDPFSAYCVMEKASGKFVGFIVLGHSQPGESEAIYIFNKEFWYKPENGQKNKKYGSQTADAMFQTLIPRLMHRGFRLDHKPLKKLVATARIDNLGSQGMLRGVGFKEEGINFKFGNNRYDFGLFAKQLRNEHDQFYTRIAQKKYLKELAELRKTDEVSAEEMAFNSSFGQSIAVRSNRH